MSKKYTQIWKYLAERWDRFYDPPGRPCRDDIRLYMHYLRKTGIKKPKALVLGATPELRDILAKVKADVTITDINREMIDAMTKLRKTKSKERKIIGSWVNMPFEDSEFDIVMGDIVLGNVPGDRQDDFLKEVSRVLKKDGYSIQRVYMVPENFRHEDPDSIIERYSKYRYTKILHSELFEALLDNTYDKKTNTVDCSEVEKNISKYMHEEGKFSHPNRKVNRLLWKTYMAWNPFEKEWCTYGEKKATEIVGRHFNILEKGRATKTHRFGKTFRIWFLKKK